MQRWRARVVVGIVALTLATTASADERSTFSNSTVLGFNTGLPTGTGEALLADRAAGDSIGRVDFVAESAFYFKNMELLGLEEVEGETLFGFLLPLRFRYRAHARLQIELGAIVGEDYGDADRANVAEPLVRLTYSPRPHLHVVAGTIHATHWIHDALVDDTNKLRGRAEQGVQLRVDGDRYKQDLWANWRIRETRLEPEEFEIASASQVRVFDDLLRVDVHGIWSHAGGQITESDRLENNLVFLAGGSLGRAWTCRAPCVLDVRVAGRYLHSIKSGRDIDRDTGRGWEVELVSVVAASPTISGRIHASYHRGSDLRNERGDPLYRLDDYAQLGGALV
ncbi:MAG: hypothetical protein GY733_19095, partial [bacterium]|nr:hypothetical protein [bacterium]